MLHTTETPWLRNAAAEVVRTSCGERSKGIDRNYGEEQSKEEGEASHGDDDDRVCVCKWTLLEWQQIAIVRAVGKEALSRAGTAD